MAAMHDVKAIWDECLPEIKDKVTGIGVWTALDTAVPIAYEDATFVLGLPSEQSEIAGHLRVPQVNRSIADALSLRFNQRVTPRIINGTRGADWETEKRRDAEKRRIQDQALQRERTEAKSAKSWDTIYSDLNRAYTATPNRSLPQNRAKFLIEAVDILVEALIETPVTDDLAERQYARCLERIAKYTELPSTFVAMKVLEKTFAG